VKEPVIGVEPGTARVSEEVVSGVGVRVAAVEIDAPVPYLGSRSIGSRFVHDGRRGEQSGYGKHGYGYGSEKGSRAKVV
jgi:hypothetical protein